MITVIDTSTYDSSLVRKFKVNAHKAVDKLVPRSREEGLIIPIKQGLIMQPVNDCHAALLVKKTHLFATFFPINQTDSIIKSIQKNMRDTDEIIVFTENFGLNRTDHNPFIRSVDKLFAATNTKCTAIYLENFSNPGSAFQSSVVATKGKIYLNGRHIVSEYNNV